MTVGNRTPRDYYRVLGVSPAAGPEDIRRAYHRLAKDLHPDLNPDADAAERLKLVTAAYNVLKQAGRRAGHATADGRNRPGRQARRFAPVACSRCHAVTAQPRFVVFHRVTSALVRTVRRPVQGIYCASCATRTAVRASLVTWLCGWWGLPWGPFATAFALLGNLRGGRVPPEVNADLLAHQAFAFFEAGERQLAGGVARHARDYARRARRNDLVTLLDELIAAAPQRLLRNPWRGLTRMMLAQAAMMLLFVAALGLVGAAILL